ncbi:MAG: hypothetical protein ACK56I_13650, partial [bacterium]
QLLNYLSLVPFKLLEYSVFMLGSLATGLVLSGGKVKIILLVSLAIGVASSGLSWQSLVRLELRREGALWWALS